MLRVEPNLPASIVYPWRFHRHLAQAGLDRAFRQMTIAHHPRSTRLVPLTLMPHQKLRHLRLHRLRQQRTGAFAQYLGQRVANCARNPWLLQLQNVIVSHGVFTPYKRLMILADHQEYAVFSFRLINNFQA